MRSLSNPPIVESQAFFKFDPPIDKKEMDNFGESIKGIFPIKKNRYGVVQEFKLKDGVKPSSAPVHEINGLVFHEEDNGEKIIFLHKDLFIFSFIGKYQNWEVFQKMLITVTDLFSRFFKSTKVTQIGIRFINKIYFEVPVDLSKKLNLLPSLNMENHSFSLENFLLRYNIMEEKNGLKGVINLVDNGIVDESNDEIILDIAVSKKIICEIGSDRMWEMFKEIREFKNELFFNTLTEECLKEFE